MTRQMMTAVPAGQRSATAEDPVPAASSDLEKGGLCSSPFLYMDRDYTAAGSSLPHCITGAYPAWIYTPFTYFDMLTESADNGFFTIEFTVLKTDEDVQEQADFMSNAIDEGAAYDLEELELHGHSAQKLIVTDEYDIQVIYVPVPYDEDTGTAGIGLYIEAGSWETADDTDVVMDILNSIVIN